MWKTCQTFLLVILLPVWAAFGECGSNAVQAEARRILANAKVTQYSHRTDVNETEGRYFLDCSGLVTLILRKAAPKQLKAVNHAENKARPRAFEFYEAFVAAPTNAVSGWRQVNRLIDACPGDLIAWRKEKIVPGESTGHIVIVDAVPVMETNGTFRVVVIDSTTSPHAEDSRKGGKTGVGRGTMWFAVNAAGEPVGTMRKDSTAKPWTSSPIAIGRVVEQ